MAVPDFFKQMMACPGCGNEGSILSHNDAWDKDKKHYSVNFFFCKDCYAKEEEMVTIVKKAFEEQGFIYPV